MARTTTTLMISALAALTVVSCSSSNATKSTAAPGGAAVTSPAGDTAPAGESGGEAATVPSDVCALFDNATVSALVGETVVGEPTPNGGCRYPASTAQSLAPIIEIAPDFEGAGGIAGAQSGVEAMVGTPAAPLTVGGYSGYLVSGTVPGTSMMLSQGAVAVKGLIVTIGATGPDAAQNAAVITALMETVVGKL